MADPARVESVDDEEEEMNLMETGEDDNARAPQKVGEERDLTGDGGVLKKLLVAGEGWELPEKDDKVYVHYTGTLTDGTKFDSSVDRGAPFSFTLGASQVIKGWDAAVATMKLGEKVQLTLREDYAYGENGSPPTIPGGATLLFEVELLRWESVNDLSDEKDFSLVRQITKECDLNVWDRPQDVDLVTILLSAKVADTEEYFEKDLKHEFKMGDGFFCPAVNRVVKQMKQGEAVRVKAGPQYAFGDEGREGCPPGSKVELTIELLQVKAVKSIDPDHQGLLIKTILKDGAAHQCPNDTSEVTVSWTGKLADGTEFDKVEEADLKVQDDPFPNEAVELAVMSMRHGEEAEVTMQDARFGYGATGLEGKVPANELVSYYINMHSFINGPEYWDMKPAEKIEMAEKAKGRGNQALKAGNLGRARRLYEKVSGMLSMEEDFSEEEKAASREVQVSTSLNTAAAALKQGKHKDCISECNKVLEKRAGNVKALYRRSQAYLERGDMLEAETDLKNALLSDPDSAELAAAIKRLKARMKEANKKDAKLFGAMFSKVGKMYEDVKVVESTGAIDEPGLEVPEGAAVDAPKTIDGEGDAIMQPLDADGENVSGNV